MCIRDSQGSGGGHDDGGLHPGGLGGIGHALGVVAGGGGDESPRFLLLAQQAGFIVRAADFVRAGDLQVFGLQIDFVAAQVGKIGTVNKFGIGDHAPQHAAGLLELVECKHG